MTRMHAKWDDFLSVIDASPDTELAIVAALVIPTFLWIAGAWLAICLESPGPVDALTGALCARLDLLFALLAVVLYWRLGMLAYTSYRHARRRLLGDRAPVVR